MPKKSCLGDYCNSKTAPPLADNFDAEPIATEQFENLEDSQKYVVITHNKHRSEIGVNPLQWSGVLEKYAKQWAKNLVKRGCPLEHRPNPKYGENLFWSQGRYYEAEAVVNAWASEKADYNASNNTCASGKVCGHYTQLVWSTTTHVGCASDRCEDSNQEVWVCNYHPFGNIIGRSPF